MASKPYPTWENNYDYPEGRVHCINATDGSDYYIRAKEFSCIHFGHCACPRIRAEPDIAGRGVIAAFVFTAFLTLLTTVFCLVIGRAYEDRQYFNPIDRFCRKHVSNPLRKLMFRLHMNPNVQGLVAYDLVNTLSDLQLVTGVAILVGGMAQLVDGTISTYHFMMVTDLAWFCTNTHLFSLLVITSMHDSVKRTSPERGNHEHRALAARLGRLVRICLMAATVALLMYALWVTGYEGVYDEGQYRCPMRCSLALPRGGRASTLMALNMALMGYFYALRIFMSWRTGRIFWMDRVRGRLIDGRGQPVDVLRPELVFGRRWGRLDGGARGAARAVAVATWYFFASEVETVAGLVAYFVFGMASLVDDRTRGHDLMEPDEREEENRFMFSQLVPIFLLLIPFMGLFSSYARHSKAEAKKARERERERERERARAEEGADAPRQSLGTEGGRSDGKGGDV